MNKKKLFKYLDEPERSLYIGMIITAFALAALTGILLFLVNNVRGCENLMTCIFYTKTGKPCPGCGGTRAVLYLLKGNILKSIYYHVAVIYILSIGSAFFVTQTIRQITKGRTKAVKWHDWYWIVGLTIFFIQYILKLTLPGYVL